MKQDLEIRGVVFGAVLAGAALGCGSDVQRSTSGAGGGAQGSTSGASTTIAAGAGGAGGGASTTSSAGPGGAGGTTTSTSTSTTGTGTGGGGGGAPAVPGCYPTCNTAADCATMNPVIDLDNWACNGGSCEYTGCNSTEECTEGYMSPKYVCALGSASPHKACYTTCDTAANCAVEDPTLDADNWACLSGRCEYTGCNSTQECIDSFMSPSFVCALGSASPVKSCYPTCNTAADCAQPNPLFDADNWVCNGGKCEYTGCNSTKECTDGNMSPEYMCK